MRRYRFVGATNSRLALFASWGKRRFKRVAKARVLRTLSIREAFATLECALSCGNFIITVAVR
jgi:hypothetical protein